MNLAADASRRVLLLAPVGRDAKLGCATLGKAGIDCLAGRDLADLDATALDEPTGRVSVHWRLEPASGADELTVEWQERGGPRVSPPTRRGFGSLLIEQALASDLGGSTELTFNPAGVAYKISARVPASGG